MSFDQIELSLSNLKENVHKACIESGRDPSGVNILAVSKGQSIDAIKEAYRVGHHNFGENYLQEAKKKYMRLVWGLGRDKGVEAFHNGEVPKPEGGK